MPRPPTMMAICGHAFLVRRQFARLGEHDRRTGPARPDDRDGAVPRRLAQFRIGRALCLALDLPFGVGRRVRRLLSGIARNRHFLGFAVGAVNDGDGLAAGRRRDDLHRDGAVGRFLLGRAVIAGVVDAVARALRLGRGAGLRLLGRDHRDRLAAERVVGEDRPGGDHDREQPKHARDQMRQRDRQLPGFLGLVLAERGVQLIRGHGRRSLRIMGQV